MGGYVILAKYPEQLQRITLPNLPHHCITATAIEIPAADTKYKHRAQSLCQAKARAMRTYSAIKRHRSPVAIMPCFPGSSRDESSRRFPRRLAVRPHYRG